MYLGSGISFTPKPNTHQINVNIRFIFETSKQTSKIFSFIFCDTLDKEN